MSGTEPEGRRAPRDRQGATRRAGAIAAALAVWVGLSGTATAADAGPPVQRPRAMLEPAVPAPTRDASTDAAPDAAAAQVEPPQPIDAAPADATASEATQVPASPTRSAEAPETAESAPAPAPRASPMMAEPVLRKQAKRTPKQYRHNGFVIDGRLGTVGCVRTLCGADRHDARPGVRLDGFLGGNIRGWVDLGVSGGWGTMTPRIDDGTNVLTLYGLDPVQLQQALDLLGGQALGIDLASLAVTDAKMRAAQFGPLVRVHFIPRGRFTAYVGTGAQYNLFRTKYETTAGNVRLDFHGIAVPIQAGFGVHVLENLAVGVQFDYLWSWYGLATVDHPSRKFTLPVRVLESAAQMQQVDLRRQLPHFWTFGFALRARV
jgi:type IV secretory pathway VirB10-like protein